MNPEYGDDCPIKRTSDRFFAGGANDSPVLRVFPEKDRGNGHGHTDGFEKTEYRLKADGDISLRSAVEPLVIWDGYFDVTEIKTAFFAVCTLVYLTARAVCALQFGRGEHAPETSDVFSLVLCAIALLASAGSGFFRLSLLGPAGRWQGAAMLWLYAGVFFALRDVPVRTGAVTVPLCAGLAVSAALACLDHLGFDPLGFGAALDEYSRGRYISTLGNINFAGAYLSLALPVCVHRLLLSERRPAALALGGVCAVGLWAVMAVRSECAILGLGAGLLLMPFVLGDRLEALRRWCLLWPAAALAAQLYRAAAVLCLTGFSSLTARSSARRPRPPLPLGAPDCISSAAARPPRRTSGDITLPPGSCCSPARPRH